MANRNIGKSLMQKRMRLNALGSLAPKFQFGFQSTRAKSGTEVFKLPFIRNKVFIAISFVFFAAFCIPYFTVGSMFSEPNTNNLFDFIFNLFSFFWLLGWTVGVTILGLVFLVLTLGRETLHVRPGSMLLRIEVLGFGVGVDYKARGIDNLHLELSQKSSGNEWRDQHLAFDYGSESISFGSNISVERSNQIIAAIQTIAIAKAPELDYQPPEPEVSEAVVTANLASQKATVAPAIAKPALTSISAQALIAANLIPLFGVFLFDWSIGDIMLLFWAESAVIGFYNLLKMWVVGRWSVLFLGPFFVGHFGGFMAGHLLFIYAFFFSQDESLDPTMTDVFADFLRLWPALLGFLISHGISHWQNFLGRNEYIGRSINQQMGVPYKRIIIMHVTIIFGGFLVMAFDAPVLALSLLILLKIIVDTKAHLGEHSTKSKAS